MVPTDQAMVRLAQGLVATYGEDAAAPAYERAEAMERIGNADAARIWAAVEEILRRAQGRGGRPDA
jgi:hypothetical protein